MFSVHKKEIEWGGRKLSLETGMVARQADGAVIATYGETSVLATVVGAKKSNPDFDFFPLTVHYQEKAFAAGKIPGGFYKREGRPSEKETLTSRLIDRPIRPLFVDNFKNEVQIVCTLLSHDMENDAAALSIIAASAALTISGLPFLGPIGAADIGYKDGEFILNPTKNDLETSELELSVAGTREGVLMVESEAKELSEDLMLKAVMYGHEQYQKVIDLVIDLAEDCAKDPWELDNSESKLRETVFKKIDKEFKKPIEKAYKIKEKQERRSELDKLKEKAVELFAEDETVTDIIASGEFHHLEKDIVRSQILKKGVRIDERDTRTVRPIDCKVGIIPRTHGSSLFTRGETQALVVSTLGTGQDEQIIDSLSGEYRENFMLHYNFPPYSVGEAGRLGSPGRREIGHGKLAWRAIHPVLPTKEEFPYTIRVVSEITESNGSSSMATVCGTSLALMDTGVPLKRPVAGIAMGLIKEGDDFAVLTDILGDEDHLGDMDFKVAGTENGVTSLQMDIKITSITEDIMKQALEQAHEGRIHILKEMASTISENRDDVNANAPRIEVMTIPKDKIRDVIGTGGKVIREITEKTGVKIDIDDDGTIKVASTDSKSAQEALDWIKNITAEPEIGEKYQGKVVKIMDFGAFVNFLGDNSGLVHISELKEEKVQKVTDVVNEGDEVTITVIGIDNRGKIRLSMRENPQIVQGNDRPRRKNA